MSDDSITSFNPGTTPSADGNGFGGPGGFNPTASQHTGAIQQFGADRQAHNLGVYFDQLAQGDVYTQEQQLANVIGNATGALS